MNDCPRQNPAYRPAPPDSLPRPAARITLRRAISDPPSALRLQKTHTLDAPLAQAPFAPAGAEAIFGDSPQKMLRRIKSLSPRRPRRNTRKNRSKRRHIGLSQFRRQATTKSSLPLGKPSCPSCASCFNCRILTASRLLIAERLSQHPDRTFRATCAPVHCSELTITTHCKYSRSLFLLDLDQSR
jgi:hypothetical protein